MPAAEAPPAIVKPTVARPTTIVAPKREQGVSEVTKEYWIGMVPDESGIKPLGPKANYAIAGVEIAFYVGNVDFGTDGRPDRELKIGKRHYLSDKQVEKFKADMLTRVVRWSLRESERQHDVMRRTGEVLDVRGADPKFAPHMVTKDGRQGDPIFTYKSPLPHEEQDEPFGQYVFMYEVLPGVQLPDRPEPMIARA